MNHHRIAGVLAMALLAGMADTSSAAISYATRVLSDAPIRYYRFDEVSGTTAYDSSSNMGHGAYVGSPALGQPGALAGSSNGSVFLDGSDDEVSVPDAADLRLTGDMTVEMWYQKDVERGDWVRVAGKGNPTHRNYGVWDWKGNDGRVKFQQFNNGGSVLENDSVSSIPVDQWAHVVATVEGNTTRLYIDGQLDSTATRSGPPSTSNDPLRIGYAGLHDRFQGYVDEVAVYDAALSAGQVKAHHNTALGLDYAGITVNDGAAAYYRFEDATSGDGDTAADSIGSSHGTYHGAANLVSSASTWGGTAASFDGANDYVQIPASAVGNYPSISQLSFETWVKTTDDGVILGQVDNATPAGGSPGGWVPALYVDGSGAIRASMFWHGSTTSQVVSDGGYNDGLWHHVVNVFDNGTETLYIDGEKVGSQNFGQTGYGSGNYQYFLGAGHTSTSWAGAPGGWWYYEGMLDEAAFYPVALSEADIQAHFAARLTPEPATTVVWMLLAALGLAAGRRRRAMR